MKEKNYKAFYITAIVVALINFANISKFNALPGIPILATGFAVAYCLLMPRINLLTASLVFVGLGILNGMLMPVAQKSGQANLKLFAGIMGICVYALAAPMLIGWIAHGISLASRRKKSKEQPSSLPDQK
ncbi:MAG TPA: hypothetical protein PKM67_06810 [Kiritimatiellia bacterium]|nr:hypothetical protein [Kiritimatiellia bacterium]